MRIPANWFKVMGIALSIPSTIFFSAWISMKLVKWGYLSKLWGIIIFLSLIINSLIALVWNGVYKKD